MPLLSKRHIAQAPRLNGQSGGQFSRLMYQVPQVIEAYLPDLDSRDAILRLTSQFEDFARPYQAGCGLPIPDLLLAFAEQTGPQLEVSELSASELLHAAQAKFIGPTNTCSHYARLASDMRSSGVNFYDPTIIPFLEVQPPRNNMQGYQPRLRAAFNMLFEHGAQPGDIWVRRPVIDETGHAGLRNEYVALDWRDKRCQIIVCDRVDTPSYLHQRQTTKIMPLPQDHAVLARHPDFTRLHTADFDSWQRQLDDALEKRGTQHTSSYMLASMYASGMFTSLDHYFGELLAFMPANGMRLPDLRGRDPARATPGPGGDPRYWLHRNDFFRLHTGIDTPALIEHKLAQACNSLQRRVAHPARPEDGAIPGWGGIAFADMDLYLRQRCKPRSNVPANIGLEEWQQKTLPRLKPDASLLAQPLYAAHRNSKQGILLISLQHIEDYGCIPTTKTGRNPPGAPAFWLAMDRYLRSTGTTLTSFIRHEIALKQQSFEQAHHRAPTPTDGPIPGWGRLEWRHLHEMADNIQRGPAVVRSRLTPG